MKILKLIVTTLLVFACSFALAQSPSLPSNIYGAGASFNHGAGTPIAGTGLYAHLISDGTGTYAFTVVDAVPAGVRPFTVTTSFGAGVAQKVFSVGKLPVFIPTSAGIAYNGNNTGWAWSTGGMTQFKIKGSWYAMPTVRVQKSSVSGGAGYQPILGLLFAYEQ